MVTREQIMERLSYAQLTIGTSRANFFDEDVPERMMRNIVAILIFGDGTASRTVEIEKVKDGHETPPTDPDDYDMIFDNVPVPPAAVVPLPQEGYNIENAIVVLEGGTNLSAVASAGAPEATLIYWDTELA